MMVSTMNLSLDKIEEVYGKNTITIIKEDIDLFINNINYLKTRGFNHIEDLVELYPYSFLQEEDVFQNKVNLLMDRLGVESIEKIMENTELWSDVDES